jgi:hypothetical protein
MLQLTEDEIIRSEIYLTFLIFFFLAFQKILKEESSG